MQSSSEVVKKEEDPESNRNNDGGSERSEGGDEEEEKWEVHNSETDNANNQFVTGVKSLWSDLSKWATETHSSLREYQDRTRRRLSMIAIAPATAAPSPTSTTSLLFNRLTSMLSQIDNSSPLTILGTEFSSPKDLDFIDLWCSKVWVTYRSAFPKPLTSSTEEDTSIVINSDIGWGCMVRSAQMLVANALLYLRLGKGFRMSRLHDQLDPISLETYKSVVTLFLDDPLAPLSLHNIATLGKNVGKGVGEWYGPNTVAHVVSSLVNERQEIDLKIVVADDGVVYRTDIERSFPPDIDEWSTPLLLLVPLRLGLDKMNSIYFEQLKFCLTRRECVGIAGGQPKSALYFIGFQQNNVLFLDPHVSRPSVKILKTTDGNALDPTRYSLDDLDSYHCSKISAVPITSVDPSLLIGFAFANRHDFQDFCREWREKLDSGIFGKHFLFEIGHEKPKYYCDETFLMDSIEEEFL